MYHLAPLWQWEFPGLKTKIGCNPWFAISGTQCTVFQDVSWNGIPSLPPLMPCPGRVLRSWLVYYVSLCQQ
jgi:hypothetical protein